MKNFTVISDPGIDDLIALALLYKLAPKASHCLISSFGNAPENITAQNAKEFISLVAPYWKFVHGAVKPVRKLEHPWPDYFHGPNGVWGTHLRTDIENIKEMSNYPDNKDVISLAPMTVAYQLLNDDKIKEITIMGGAFNEEGNETKYAETNIAFDPESAYYFFNKCKEIEVRVVPLNVTRKVFWTKKEVSNIPEVNGINMWLKNLLITWFEKYNHQREENFNLHDPLAVFLTFFPGEAKWLKSGIKVKIKSQKRGETCFDRKNPVCKIALDLIKPSAVSKKLFGLVFGSIV